MCFRAMLSRESRGARVWLETTGPAITSLPSAMLNIVAYAKSWEFHSGLQGRQRTCGLVMCPGQGVERSWPAGPSPLGTVCLSDIDPERMLGPRLRVVGSLAPDGT